MDELAYWRYIKSTEEEQKKAEETYRTIRELYGLEIPWSRAYFKALQDKLLSREEKELVKKYYPLKFK